MSAPTVFVVDDDAAVRDALSLLISLKGLRVSTFSCAEDFLAIYEPQWRGCLLADLQMPGMSGLELQHQLAERGISLPVIMLTAHGDVATARAALKNGAVDFLEKPVDDDVLVDVLQNAIRVDADRHRAQALHLQVTQRLERLTAREKDVLLLLSQGLQHREIAARLAISPRTVEVYKARMMEKLQCRTLAEVIRIGAEARGDAPESRGEGAPAEPQ